MELVIPTSAQSLPRVIRFSLGLFALAALAMLLVAAWLRFLVPTRQPDRVRDVSWLRPER